MKQAQLTAYDICRIIHASIHIYAGNLFLVLKYQQLWDRVKYIKIRLTNVEQEANHEQEESQLGDHILEIIRQVAIALPVSFVWTCSLKMMNDDDDDDDGGGGDGDDDVGGGDGNDDD